MAIEVPISIDSLELDVRPEFRVHMLNDGGKIKAMQIAANFDELLCFLEDLCPNGRALALVRTHMELACFYAKKAMASQEENQA